MTRKLAAAQVRSQFADCLRRAEGGEPVVITRRGKAVAVLVAMDRMALPRRRSPRSRVGLAGLAGGWKGSEDLVRALPKVRR
jgi:prevent-host-death family protein